MNATMQLLQVARDAWLGGHDYNRVLAEIEIDFACDTDRLPRDTMKQREKFRRQCIRAARALRRQGMNIQFNGAPLRIVTDPDCPRDRAYFIQDERGGYVRLNPSRPEAIGATNG